MLNASRMAGRATLTEKSSEASAMPKAAAEPITMVRQRGRMVTTGTAVSAGVDMVWHCTGK